MPLTMAASGEINTVKRIQGRDETKRFLASLGFVEGGQGQVISEFDCQYQRYQNCTEQEHGQPNHDLERRLRRFA
mgnify:CR=1 FL=1